MKAMFLQITDYELSAITDDVKLSHSITRSFYAGCFIDSVFCSRIAINLKMYCLIDFFEK
jgi:hypothetical protein